MYHVLYKDGNAKDAIGKLMGRAKTHESEEVWITK